MLRRLRHTGSPEVRRTRLCYAETLRGGQSENGGCHVGCRGCRHESALRVHPSVHADTGEYIRWCLYLSAHHVYRHTVHVLLQSAFQHNTSVGRQQDPVLVPVSFHGVEHHTRFILHPCARVGSGRRGHRHGVLARLVGRAVLHLHMYRKFDILKTEPYDRIFRKDIAGQLLSVGVPMGLQFSITAIGSIMLQSANNALGTACVAAFTAAMRIKMFVMCPLDGLGMAMATYSGQNYGAGKPDRIWMGIKSAILMMVIYSVAIAIVMWGLADKFALLFISPDETEIMKDTVLFLHINTSCFILLGLLSILRYSIQGAGYTRLSMFSGVSEMIARVLVSLILVPELKFWGVCLGDPTAWLFANLFLVPAFIYVYRRLKEIVAKEGRVLANA